MAVSEDLINFDLIETHKENIQQLPGGRSAKQLAAILSPVPSAKTGACPTLDETKTLNDAIRQEYETELLSIADSDDPLDIYDRYVKWTLNAYPSAQATPQSQLLPLLERATKAFLTSSHYKNDPRYLKLWLHYIRFFSDAPRETFAFLARHHIGEGLGLFYEEFSAWLEGVGRWNQADEVYRMGIEKEARPAERLLRKYNQFQQRYAAKPASPDEPSSPALPTVRPALAAKIDPFATSTRTDDPQAQRPGSEGNSSRPRSSRPKMAIFSDADNETPPPATSVTNGWDNIGSMKERKKENTMEARPWVGETLKGGKKVGTSMKMEVFKDPNAAYHESKKLSSSKQSDVINPRTGRSERVFVNLENVYPSLCEEYSFEELRAKHRGWLARKWTPQTADATRKSSTSGRPSRSTDLLDIENLSQSFQQQADIHDTSTQSMIDMPESKTSKQRKLKVREVRQETQTVKTRLDSPTGPKIKRKGSSEPTMTFHSKAATNEIYDMFNQPRHADKRDDTQSGDDTDYGDGDDTYSTAGESVNTGVISGGNSEYGDDTTRSFGMDNTGSQPESVSPWSDFTASKHVPKLSTHKGRHQHGHSEDLTDHMDSSQNQTMHSGGFDTQAIAALANQNFDELDTKMIAQLAGDESGSDDENRQEEEAEGYYKVENEDDISEPARLHETQQSNKEASEDLKTPVDEMDEGFVHIEVHDKPRFVPIPPEDYDPTPMRPYRDPAAVAQNKLPFMTPIAERTESSLAPSTIYQEKDFDQVKTPSRIGRNKPSPSKLCIDELLLSSPGEDTLSPPKRRAPNSALLATEDSQLPNEEQASASLVSGSQDVPLSVVNTETLSNTSDVKGSLTINNDDVFDASNPKNVQGDFKAPVTVKKVTVSARTHPVLKGPIIPDLQCNPVDPAIQQQILKLVHPGPSTYKGFYEHDTNLSQHDVLKKFAKKERSTKTSPRKSPRKQSTAPMLRLPGASRVYVVKKELGTGAYAAVYLVRSCDPANVDDTVDNLDNPDQPQPKGTARNALEAMKTESPAVSLAWEFHILHLLKSRLGPCARAMQSIVTAHECHLYRDECYLVLDYHSQGTVLDLVNKVRADNARAGKNVEGLDEAVAMWLSVEVLRTMEEFHKVGILHGDLKIDNCLARFEPNVELLSPYNRLGNDGWDSKGIMLIDFGRGIDIKAFKPEARFVADWKAEETDCAEIREARPWKWEIDLFGAAGIIHSLLFGKYIETVAVGGGGLGQRKEWKLRESFKRYWEKEIWHEVFHVLINGASKDAEDIRKDIVRVRCMMEEWLENESERGGRDLRSSIRRCERLLGITGGGGRGRQ